MDKNPKRKPKSTKKTVIIEVPKEDKIIRDIGQPGVGREKRNGKGKSTRSY